MRGKVDRPYHLGGTSEGSLRYGGGRTVRVSGLGIFLFPGVEDMRHGRAGFEFT